MKRWALLIVFVLLLLPGLAFAQDLKDLGVVPFGSVIVDFYNLSLRLVGIAVFVMFLIAGLSFILPDWLKPGFMNNPWKMIQDAVIGTVLLFSAYVILNTINPALTQLQGGTPRAASSASSATATPNPQCANYEGSFQQWAEMCNAGNTDACSIRDQVSQDAAAAGCTTGGSTAAAPTACTDLQIVYDQATQACATGEADACAARDQAVASAQNVGCTLAVSSSASSTPSDCTDLQIVYDQAKVACSAGEADACAARDQAVASSQSVGCTLQ